MMKIKILGEVSLLNGEKEIVYEEKKILKIIILKEGESFEDMIINENSRKNDKNNKSKQ